MQGRGWREAEKEAEGEEEEEEEEAEVMVEKDNVLLGHFVINWLVEAG